MNTMLKHIINWREISRHINNPLQHQIWTDAHKFFGNNPVDYYELYMWALTYSSDQLKYNTTAPILNGLIRNNALTLPPLHSITTRITDKTPKLQDFILDLKKTTPTHSAYAYMVAYICMSITNKSPFGGLLKKINVMTVADYNSQNGILLEQYELPRWAQIVLDRQKRLAQSIGLSDDDPLFFIMRWNSYNKDYVYARAMLNTDDEYIAIKRRTERKYGMRIQECIMCFTSYAGLKNGDSLQLVSSYSGKRAYIRSENSLNRHLQLVYHYIPSVGKRFYDYAYVLYELARGVYLMHGLKGYYVVNYSMLSHPYKKEQHMAQWNQLYTLGYKDKDFYDNATGTEIAKHRIKPRKIESLHHS